MNLTELSTRIEKVERAINRLHHENELLKTWIVDLMQILAENRSIDLNTTQECINELKEQIEENAFEDDDFLLRANLFLHKLTTSTLHGFCQTPTCEIEELRHQAFRAYYDFCEKNHIET